ncbi:MAG: hydroxymethylglutaryl-CoA synthase family protein, partial [Candidatus Lokiarchaeota archaeon]|nr:hydroxymethylglutaryl-CoA synthase family protein [Candidatus Lokiarchaeota archaeon]
PRFYLSLNDLAIMRNVDPNKYNKGLLTKEMRFPEVGEDIVSMGLKAGYNALLRGNINPKKIDAIFVGTETITYAVKSISNILAQLLGISINSLTQDVYNACAAATLAILNAIALIEKDVIKKALVIGADVSSYNLGSPGEPTQGAGAVALVLSKNPRIATFSNKFGKISGNINDFYRTANESVPQVFGRYSIDSYLNFQLGAFDDLTRNIGDFYADYYVFHAPYSKLALKCMQNIIVKRWVRKIRRTLIFEPHSIKASIARKINDFMQNISFIPEFIGVKLKDKGFSLTQLDIFKNWVLTNIKNRVIPHLKVPMHFGNMYSASVWAQILYILETSARVDHTIYFGSYGSGAICITGLLKVQPRFNRVVRHRPQITDYLKIKERKSVREYEQIKQGLLTPHISLGHIEEYKKNKAKGFTLHFCDEGCMIPQIEGLNYCPKGHSGFYTKFFPLFAVLISEPIDRNGNDLSFLKEDLVRIQGYPKRGNLLECEMRRVESTLE